eukprot:7071678-Pyramimonas_sp.AAC.1
MGSLLGYGALKSPPLKLKARLWVALARSILLCALEVRRISLGGLKKIERFQIRCLRHIARLPVQISRVASDDLREQRGVHSVESTLPVRRCLWMQKVVAPAFRDDDGGPLLGTREDDPAVAVRAAVFGAFSVEGVRETSLRDSCDFIMILN